MNDSFGIYQHTLKSPITFMGIGLHSGKRVVMTLKPAAENHGVRFFRKDVSRNQGTVIPRWHNVVKTQLCTGIANEYGVKVYTIEHLLAALQCCGIDNLVVELDAEEVPIMDGSAAPFVERIRGAGTQTQTAHRWLIQIRHPLVHIDGDKFITVLPSNVARITVEIDFPVNCIGRQIVSAAFGESLTKHIAPARTFGFADQLNLLKRQGLTRGGSLRNAILVDGQRVVNEEPLRFPDEFARHKLLDTIGDLSLAGARILGHFHACKPGHALIQAFVKKLFAYPSVWSYQPMLEVIRIDGSTCPEDGATVCQGQPTFPTARCIPIATTRGTG